MRHPIATRVSDWDFSAVLKQRRRCWWSGSSQNVAAASGRPTKKLTGLYTLLTLAGVLLLIHVRYALQSWATVGKGIRWLQNCWPACQYATKKA